MFNFFQKLLPRQGDFFGQFESHSKTLVDGAEALASLLAGGPKSNLQLLETYEHTANAITHEVLQSVRRTFLTPFDRGSITSLIGKMNEAIDQMQKAAVAIEMFEIDNFAPEMTELGEIIKAAAKTTALAIPMLRNVSGNARPLHELTEQLIKLEARSDEVQAAGMKSLFKEHGRSDPTKFIIYRALYIHLERVVDRFEDVAREIDGLVIDYA